MIGLLGNVLLEKGGREEDGVSRDVHLGGLGPPSLREWAWGPGTDLVVQHEEQRAAHAQVPRPLHLEPVRLLGGGRPVPLSTGRELAHIPGPSWLLGPGALGGSFMQICAADGTVGLGPVEGWQSQGKQGLGFTSTRWLSGP